MRFILFITYIGLLLCFTAVDSMSQSLIELRKEKEKTAADIEYINQLLKETNENVKSSLNRLAILEKQITLQGNLIDNINRELDFLDASIKISSHRVDSLTAELQSVKNKYASMIRYAKRNQDSNNQLFYLLSADDFNQAYKRFTYLRQYADYRRKQAERITEVKNSLNHQIIEFNARKEQRQNLLASRINMTKRIEKQKESQSKYFTELQQKEKELKRKLDNQKKQEAKLQQEIERVIAEEARKASRKSPTESGMVLTNEEKALSGDFSNNKGRFPWPVQHGLITDHFGEHPHAVLKKIMVRNSGIDITTQSNEKARAIFKGEVTKVIAIPGASLAVIIRHGNYLTVYSNLSEVFVKAGQKVDTKQEIGRIYTDKDDDNKTVLKFQLWRESTKLDPEEWIQRQ